MAVRFPLTATETSGRRALVTTEMIRRPGGTVELGRHGWLFDFFFKFQPAKYIYPVTVGVIEWNDSVAPRCKTASSYCNSV